MNVDFLALGGTVWTAAGAVVVACTNTHPSSPSPLHPFSLGSLSWSKIYIKKESLALS